MGNVPVQACLGSEQGPKGSGHTFESCRVRRESMCRACRGCGGTVFRPGAFWATRKTAKAQFHLLRRLPFGDGSRPIREGNQRACNEIGKDKGSREGGPLAGSNRSAARNSLPACAESLAGFGNCNAPEKCEARDRTIA